MSLNDQKTQDKLAAIKAVIPCVPFKNIDRFYDVGGVLANPVEMQYVIDLFLSRYEPLKDSFDSIGCFDARGFLFGPILGLALNKKVFMLRKKNKMPNVIHHVDYRKEYSGDNPDGGDSIGIQKDSVAVGDKVLLIDDLMATGGTVEAGISLVEKCGGSVFECAFVIELDGLDGRKRVMEKCTGVPLYSLLTSKDFNDC